MSMIYEIEFDENGAENFSDLADKLFDSLMKCGRKIMKQYLENLDDLLLQSRDKSRYRCKGKRNTAVKTKMGTIEYERRLYRDNHNNKYVYLLDDNLSVFRIEQLDNGICRSIAQMACTMPYRKVAEAINEMTALNLSHQTVWNIIQLMGKQQIAYTDDLSKLAKNNQIIGEVESKILYEEADGNWLKLQGNDRKKHGKSKEMKISIAYDGVLHQKQKGGKVRRELDNKVAYASFENAKEFKKHTEGVIAAKYNVDEIMLRIKNGDGAEWIHNSDEDYISVLDKYHRNKKIIECVSDKKIVKQLQNLLFSDKYELLLEAIEAYINSVEDENQVRKLKELYSYYSQNYDSLSDYRMRGIAIPETRQPDLRHARLGSMESNVFTLIGNRMKGGRACWSIKGGNNLAALLCKYYTVGIDNEPTYIINTNPVNPSLSPTKIKKSVGKGYEFPNADIPPTLKGIKEIAKPKSISDLSF